MSVIVQNIILC